MTGMKRLICIFLIAAILLIACGTGKSGLTWQEQYDLGMQYLTEGDYEEAIVAFTAAIEIYPNQALAYVGRGDAYILSGETNDQITAAEADYLTALELDSAAADVYGKLADVYLLLGDSEKALQILQQGADITGDEELLIRLEELFAEMSPEEEEIEEAAEDENSIFQGYYNKLIELQNLYGECEWITTQNNSYLKGLCFARLIDFDADGVDELLIAYHDPIQNSDNVFEQSYTVELWRYNNYELEKIYVGTPMGNASEGSGIKIDSHNGKYYIYTYEENNNAGSDINESEIVYSWLGLEEGTIGFGGTASIVQYISPPSPIRTIYKVNGTEVSEEEYNAFVTEWGLGYESETGFQRGFQNCGDTMMSASLTDLSETFKTLCEKLGIPWNDSTVIDEENSVKEQWIGTWENNTGSLQTYAKLTLYEDGTVGLNERNSFYWGTYEKEENESISVHISDAVLYDNVTAQWTHQQADCSILLSLTDNSELINFMQVYDNYNNHWIGGTNITLTRIHDAEIDYRSVTASVEEYLANVH